MLIAYLDHDQLYRFNNAAYEEFYGLSLDEISGRSFREIVGDEVYNRLEPYIDKTLHGKKVQFEEPLFHSGEFVGGCFSFCHGWEIKIKSWGFTA